MANNSDLGAKLVYAAGAVPTAYPDAGTILSPAQTFYAGGSTAISLWVKFTLGASSNFTGFGIKLQDSYDGSAGSWLDVQLVDQASSTTSNEIVVTGLSANTTVWRLLQTTSERFSPGGNQILFKGNGGAVTAGDAVTVYVTAW